MGTLMAKTKASKPKQEPSPQEPAIRRAVLQMKGTDEWKAWLDDLAKFLRMPTSSIVDNALVDYAKAKGFTKAAPER